MIYNDGQIQNFRKSRKRNRPTGCSRATSLPPLGDSFMYIKTSRNISGSETFSASFEPVDDIEISNITFYYKRFSLLTNDSLKTMGRFRIQLLL